MWCPQRGDDARRHHRQGDTTERGDNTRVSRSNFCTLCGLPLSHGRGEGDDAGGGGRRTSFKDSKLQQINGIAFILVFFIVRVLSIPFMYWLYANQHHNGDLLRAAQEMRWYCHGSAWAMFLIQLIWFGAAFSKVLRGARRLYSGSISISSNKKES